MGYGTKSRLMTSVVRMKAQRKAPSEGLMVSSYHSKVYHWFANGNDAKDLTWHVDGRNCDGMLHHLADSS